MTPYNLTIEISNALDRKYNLTIDLSKCISLKKIPKNRQLIRSLLLNKKKRTRKTSNALLETKI